MAQQKYSMTKLELLVILETLKKFKGMLWGQKLMVYTDNKKSNPRCPWPNLWLCLPVEATPWRVCPEIVCIKGIQNTVTNAISQLDNRPSLESENWMIFMKSWYHYTMQQENVTHTLACQEQMNLVFTNCSDEVTSYPLTVWKLLKQTNLMPVWRTAETSIPHNLSKT